MQSVLLWLTHTQTTASSKRCRYRVPSTACIVLYVYVSCVWSGQGIWRYFRLRDLSTIRRLHLRRRSDCVDGFAGVLRKNLLSLLSSCMDKMNRRNCSTDEHDERPTLAKKKEKMTVAQSDIQRNRLGRVAVAAAVLPVSCAVSPRRKQERSRGISKRLHFAHVKLLSTAAHILLHIIVALIQKLKLILF